MITRAITQELLDMAARMPVLTLTGPRQSGKTTLCKGAFPKHTYVSLENPENREFALNDPRGFLDSYPAPVILDEVQNAPSLLSYIQGIVDDNPDGGQYILTGSGQISLLDTVSQSLAGRNAIYTLLPLSHSELQHAFTVELNDLMYKGGYPRIYDKDLPPQKWLTGYVINYLERDIRKIASIGDLNTFDRFLRLCAARSGQILNLSSLAVDAGISHTTVKRWISVLQSSSIIFLLSPYHKNFSKRIIKSPKLYFFDTGLLCYLLRIQNSEMLDLHPLRGNIFETFVVSELYKHYTNRGLIPPLYWWQDKTGHEIDVIIDENPLRAVEIKASRTYKKELIRHLSFFKKIAGDFINTELIYDGTPYPNRDGVHVTNWKSI